MTSAAGSAGNNSRLRQQRVPTAQRRKARRLIMQALYQWRLSDNEPDEIAMDFQEGSHGKVDWGYFSSVFLAIPPQKAALQAHFEDLLDRDIATIDPIEWALLMLGSFELAERVDVPYKVTINEAVELAKTYGASESHKYINGVLDKLAKKLRPAELQ